MNSIFRVAEEKLSSNRRAANHVMRFSFRSSVALIFIKMRQRGLYRKIGKRYFDLFHSDYDVAFDEEMKRLIELQKQAESLHCYDDSSDDNSGIVCPRCGKVGPYDMAYCSRCGTLLNPDKLYSVDDEPIIEDDGREGMDRLQMEFSMPSAHEDPLEFCDDDGSDETVREMQDDDDLNSFFS